MLIYKWTDTKAVFQFYRDWMNSDNDERLTLLPLFFFAPGNTPMSGISTFYNGDPDKGLAYIEKILADANMPQPVNGPAGQVLSWHAAGVHRYRVDHGMAWQLPVLAQRLLAKRLSRRGNRHVHDLVCEVSTAT